MNECGAVRMDMGGDDLTNWLNWMLSQRSLIFSSSSEMEIVRSMKEQVCYIPMDFDSEVRRANRDSYAVTYNYNLPDGNLVSTTSERFQCPEMLFKPNMWRMKYNGVHKALVDSISRCNPETQYSLLRRIVISGGNTMFRGFVERFKNEVKSLVPPGAIVNVIANDNRQYSTWQGGRVLASQPWFPSTLITKKNYREDGVNNRFRRSS
jgi:actin-related protein